MPSYKFVLSERKLGVKGSADFFITRLRPMCTFPDECRDIAVAIEPFISRTQFEHPSSPSCPKSVLSSL